MSAGDKPAATGAAGGDVGLVLSFDFDAESLWMGWDARGARALSRGEFGARIAVPRILDLLRDRGLPSTWFIPGHDADMYPQLVARAADEGHEIANHGYLHENVWGLEMDAVRTILRKGNESLERITGRRPVGFRAPDGDFDRRVFELLVDEGFRYDSSLKDGELDVYWARGPDQILDDRPNRWGEPLDLVEFAGSWLLQDLAYLERNSRNPTLLGGFTPRMVEEVWTDQIDFLAGRQGPSVTTLTLHPQCIGWGSRIAALERFIDHVLELGNVRFTTCEQVAEDFRQQPG